ncbi:DUF2982 domain-containing protein [Shewanella intestini]|uniref:DUF2982 domain-containing protein n=1 Tax=Shewanella intestini TaxID=2017544 RepID=A0ABS5HZ46_9GAMM|nr:MULTISPECIES: DUF2982 domain-containing protein [Shewanella]MBR9726843.1 DUF2982 domain-containing protein [Shewanella intestini]MRG34591.1 DUF2982 domain-containing protein [Shewanella sp. XMDDZSB0408]
MQITPENESASLSITPYSKRNAITFTVVGAVATIIGLVLFITLQSAFAIALCLFSGGVVGVLLGCAKLKQPAVSLLITTTELSLFHQRGHIIVARDNIQRVDLVRVNQNQQMVELPFIGIKIKQLAPILETMSPRLATGLLTEQRPLLMTAATQDEDLQGLEHYVGAEFSSLVLQDKRYEGVQAMFGHRCQTLAENLGYHLYIPLDMLDREPNDFVALLRQWLNNANRCN